MGDVCYCSFDRADGRRTAVSEALTERIVKYGELAAVLASGLFFGLFHGNLNQFSYAFLLGLFLGFIYVKTGKLGYTIGLHMAINFIGSSLGTWMLRVTGYMDTMETLTEFFKYKESDGSGGSGERNGRNVHFRLLCVPDSDDGRSRTDSDVAEPQKFVCCHRQRKLLP